MTDSSTTPAPRMGLTPVMLDLARVIAELTALEGRAPTQAECAREMDLSSGSVSTLVSALEARGWLMSRHPLKLRSEPPAFGEVNFEVTHSGRNFLRTNQLEESHG